MNNEKTPEKSIIIEILEKHASFGFKPSKPFYEAIGINQKRFGMLCKNKAVPTFPEVQSVCTYFNADLKEFIK